MAQATFAQQLATFESLSQNGMPTPALNATLASPISTTAPTATTDQAAPGTGYLCLFGYCLIQPGQGERVAAVVLGLILIAGALFLFTGDEIVSALNSGAGKAVRKITE